MESKIVGVSCGIDIVEVNRIRDLIENHNAKAKAEIFTEAEISYCESHNVHKFEHYAARFAGKEAIFKALSHEVETCKWQDFEILNDANGRPYVNLKCDIPNLQNIDISLSHTSQYATALVVVLYK